MDRELARYGERRLREDGCATCGDVAVPVRVIAVSGREATVEDRAGVRTSVAIDFVPDAKAGEILLVHMGVAIGRALEVAL
ncbi:HypC/HybG/HupF family hydrogenase formation chaperone [Hydrogenibacillus schlegelii]|uniref:HypC/HybG/HupF family hydrogenase formation chaperone n=1 Tax=Hydrogenibacillus schlegelii TaxID=1484 RepID=A0A947CWQ8_HYDSH|nr:HypC/HybG/HupF family hydrogenase formation chaperone [Hydrogenibacillus schlegelii]